MSDQDATDQEAEREREIAEAAKEIADGAAKRDDKVPSQASLLVALARERYDLFMSQDGRPYGVQLDGANVALPLRGRAGLRARLALLYTDKSGGTTPSQSALADAMTVLEGAAAVAEPRELYLRVAPHADGVVVDLGTPDGRCVLVAPDGWRRAPRSPVLFRRSGAMKAMPDPVHDGDGLAKLEGLLNTDEEGFRLLVAWLVAAFLPKPPHPILTFRGEQGTGKSKAAQMVIGIIDPSGAPKRTQPRDMKSWATQAFNSWALCLDNVSVIADWLSDALCRAVTGEGVVDRALYTDDDVVVLEFQRVLAMTTIDAGALAGDLAERLLTIELNLIPDDKRREEAEMDAAYAEALPGVLASLFDLLADVLAVLPAVELTERPRMADFARVLAAVDKVKGWTTLDTYKGSARNAVADILDGEPFAHALVDLVDRSGPEGLTKTAGQILELVITPVKIPKKWPKDATRAGGYIKRLAPALRTIGIDVDDTQRETKGNRSRLYKLTASESRRTAAPAAPPAPEPAPDQGQRAGASAESSTRTGAGSTRGERAAGAAIAGAGADETAAPAHGTAADLRERRAAGAMGAAGAETRSLSNVCTVCDKPLDPFWADVGDTTHPTCDPRSAA